MAINKKLIHFKNKENFDIESASGNVSNDSLIFIQDSKEISTHNTIYKSINWGVLGDGVVVTNKINYSIINSFLRKKSDLLNYETSYYYESLESAVTDINNNSIGTLSTDINSAKVRVVRNNIFFLDNLILNSSITVSSTINIYTDTKQLICNSPINVTGCLNIYAEKSRIISNSSIFLNVSGYCSLIGGEYILNIDGTGTMSNLEKSIIVSGTLNIKNVSLDITNPIGAATVIWTEENSTLKSFNSIITCNIKGGFSFGLYSNGNTKLEHCKIVANADHTANAAGNDYGTTSRGIRADAGFLELYECYVYGAHSGMTVKCPLKIVGGIYDGFSHGGIYASSGNCNIELYDCELRDVDIPDGYTFDSIAGTNNASFYIGGASNMNIYVDNCKFYGKVQPIVMKYNSSSSHDNYLYLSNAIFNTNYTRAAIRNDGANYVKFGINVNITSEDLENNYNWEETGLCYRQ